MKGNRGRRQCFAQIFVAFALTQRSALHFFAPFSVRNLAQVLSCLTVYILVFKKSMCIFYIVVFIFRQKTCTYQQNTFRISEHNKKRQDKSCLSFLSENIDYNFSVAPIVTHIFVIHIKVDICVTHFNKSACICCDAVTVNI